MQLRNKFNTQEAFEKMLGLFATASRRTPIHQVSLLTPPAHRCPRRRRQRRRRQRQQRQRQRVTEGTAMAPWNGPNNKETMHNIICPPGSWEPQARRTRLVLAYVRDRRGEDAILQ